MRAPLTPERYEQGLTYQEFVTRPIADRYTFEHDDRAVPVTADDLAFFAAATALPHGPAKILAIAEAWCGDVSRELETMARMAEATGATLRIFLRDRHPEIVDAFLGHDGTSRAVPVFVFCTRDLRYLTHVAGRAAADAEDAPIGEMRALLAEALHTPDFHVEIRTAR